MPPPDGYHSVNPYIVVEGVESLIRFLSDVFDGLERGDREVSDDGAIAHAEVRIGDSVVMLSEATATYPARPSVHILAPAEQPWGNCIGGFHDPFANRWWIATRRANPT